MGNDADEQHRLLAELARTSLTRLPVLADNLVDQVWGEVYTRDGPVPKDDLWRSCRDNLDGMLTALDGSGPSLPDLLHAAQETGTRRAYQHCPLDWVLHAWRVGGQVMWTDFAHQVGVTDTRQLEQLVASATEVWGVTERFSIEMAATYQNLEQELHATTDTRLMAVVDALLDDRLDEVRAEAETALKLAPEDQIVVIAVENSTEFAAAPHHLSYVLHQHGVRSVWRLRAGCQIGLAVTGQLGSGELATILDEHAAGRIGVSPSTANLRGVGGAYRMAMLAMTTLPEGHAAAEALDDCLPDALLLSAPELAERIITVTFGQVLALPAAEREELLDTVSVWISSLGSTVNAAKALFCHRNTVLNRLRRVESLTGLNLGEVRVWPQVIMALSALRRNRTVPGFTVVPREH
ncbi:PucR family transcriptional regulator [Amycolatopsis antarctica]|nr:helix-turn-helix domain-containing protein [Amycolatopsis antarctica]